MRSYGPRSFAVSGPVLWNSLPAAVRDPALTVPQFLRRLKTVNCLAEHTDCHLSAS